MSAQDCIRIIEQAAGGRLSSDEVEEIVEELSRRAEARRAAEGIDRIDDVLFDEAERFADEAAAAAQIERRNRLFNIRVKATILRSADDVDAATGDPSLALQAVMVGINKRLPGARRSVDARGNALLGKYFGGMHADLIEDDLLPFLASRELEREIARELWEISRHTVSGGVRGNPGASGSDEALRIARIVDKYRRLAVADENRAGAWIRPIEGYVVRQTHDMHSIRRAGFEQWRDDVLPLLDHDATFAGAPPDEFLRAAYAGIASGVHIRANGGGESDLGLAFKGPGNLAKRVSQHRVLHFRDSDAWLDYNKRYGRGSLVESLLHEFERASRNTALMETFGPNPRAMFDTLVGDLQERFRADPRKVDRLRRNSLENQFREIDGTTRIPANATAASVTAGTLAIEAMAKLGTAFLSSLSDLAFKSTTLLQDGGLIGAWGRALGSTLDGLPARDRLVAAELIGVGLDGQMGAIASRWSAQDDVPGRLARLQTTFFRYNLLTPWTNANKRGLALMWSRDLAMNRNTAWADLPQRELLELYGMTAETWDVARKAIRTAGDGREYLFPDAVRDLTDDEVNVTGAAMTPRQAARLRDHVETTLRSYIADRADEAVPSPGARERAILKQGTQPGTAVGVAARLVGQFKAFPITVLTRQIGRITETDSVGEFFRAMARGKGANRALVHMFVASTVMGYVAMAAKDISKGRTPRDPTDWSTWLAAMAQGGGLGIYGDFLLGETNRFGRSLLDTLAGPTLGTISDIDELRAKLIAGDPLAADSLRTLVANAPFANLFYTKLALDHLILFELQEAINPGYLRRMERRVRREQGQDFWLPPTG